MQQPAHPNTETIGHLSFSRIGALPGRRRLRALVRAIWILILAGWVVPTTTVTADPGDGFGLDQVGHWADGTCYAVWSDGVQRILVGRGPTLEILDILGPGATDLRSSITFSTHILDLKVVGSIAYLATYGDGIRVVDISDLDAPMEIGVFPVDRQIRGMDVEGSSLWFTPFGEPAQGLDVSDPTNPTLVGVVDAGGSLVSDVDIVGSLLYVAGFGGLHIYDIDDPADPLPLSEGAIGGSVTSVAVEGSYAYLARWNAGFEIVDVSDPASPVSLSVVDTPGYARRVAPGTFALYVMDGSGGLRAYDVTNPAAPIEVEAWDTPTNMTQGGTVIFSGPLSDYVFLADGPDGYRWLEAFLGSSFTLLDERPSAAVSEWVVVRDQKAFIASAYEGLRVLDVSDPADPTEMGFLSVDSDGDLPDGVRELAVSGSGATVAMVQQGFVVGPVDIIDVSDPTNPVYNSGWPLPSGAVVRSLDFEGEELFVLGQDGVLYLLDVTDSSAPVLLGSLPAGTSPRVAVAQGRVAFVAAGDSLNVLDFSDPANPVKVGGFEGDGTVASVDVADDILVLHYELSGSRTLFTYDVSDPTSPSLIGDTPLTADGYVWGGRIQFDGEVAAVPSGSAGVVLIDVSAPDSPEIIGYWISGASTKGCSLAGPQVVLANGSSGVLFLEREGVSGVDDMSTALPPRRIEASPNPFCSETTIRLGEGDFGPDVRVDVFDSMGRCLRTLPVEAVGAVWDGRDDRGRILPSGVYFVRTSGSSGLESSGRVTLRR